MKAICETCGNQGWKGLLVTCSKCRIACEHCYCMREYPFDTSIHFVCADCSTRPVKKSFTSDSIKAIPGSHRNKVRVESSNPVPKWKTIPETSKMKLISPEEARKLSYVGNKSTFKVPRPVPARSAMGLTKQTAYFPRARILNSAVVAHKTNPVLFPPKKVEAPSPRTLQIHSEGTRQASKALAVVEGSKSKIGYGGKYQGSREICQSILSEKLLQLLPYRPAVHPTWNPHSPSPSQEQIAHMKPTPSATATHVDNGERLLQSNPILLQNRFDSLFLDSILFCNNIGFDCRSRSPLSTCVAVAEGVGFMGCIVASAIPSEFKGVFLAQPASTIRGRAYRLSMAIPILLKVELVPIGNLLNDLFVNRRPGLSDVEIYIFQDDKNTKRFKEEHTHLFEVMRTQNAMIRINIKDTPLLIFSSKLLDKSSQIIIEMQKKTHHFLWGIFLLTKKSVALVPGTSNQTAQNCDDGDVVDNAIKRNFRNNNHRNSGKQLQRYYTERY